MRVRDRFQCSEPVDKIIHDVSGVSSLTCSSSITAHPILLPLLVQRWARLHGYERRAARLEPGGDTAKRLALPALLLVLPRAEESLAPGGVRRERRAAVGLDGEDVRLESERVDELEKVCVGGGAAAMMMQVKLTYGFTLSGSGWMSGGSST